MMVTFAVDARTVGERFPGIGRYVSGLLRAIERQLRQNEQIVYLCSAQQKAVLGLPVDGRLLWAESDASPFGIAQQWQIPRLLQAYGANVYHSPYYLMPYRPGVPTVLTVYDVIPELFPKHVSRRARLFFRLTTRLALKSADRVIAISDTTHQDFRVHFKLDSKKITTIPLAAEAKFAPVPAGEVDKMRWKYGVPAKYVLYVGSNKPHKNVTRLIQAWPHVREWTRTPLILVVAGYLDARYPEMYEAIAQLGLGDVVRLLPNVAEQDLPALYSGAQVFIFASSYEGFGLPVLEAMACGCAVACADSSALREVAGDAAIFFDPQQPADIARAVVTLLQQPRREEFQQKVLERSAQFSWDFVAQQTVRTYRQAAKLYPVCTPRL